MPIFWIQEDLQPLRNTSMAEKLSGKWPMTGCHVEPPTQVKSAQDLTHNILAEPLGLSLSTRVKHKTLLLRDFQLVQKCTLECTLGCLRMQSLLIARCCLYLFHVKTKQLILFM